jgi:hypothetical protein
MFEEVINKFETVNKDKIDSLSKKNKLVLFDRALHDQVIRGSISILVLNDLFNYEPVVVTDKSEKDWQIRVYRSFGIQNFVNSWGLKVILKSPIIFFQSIILTIKNIFLILFNGFHWFIDNSSINGVECGDLIYDTYIRKNFRFLNPKAYNLIFITILFKSIFKILLFQNLFKKLNVKVVVSNSVTSASNSALGLRVAAQLRIKTFFSSHNFIKFYETYDETFIHARKISRKDLDKLESSKDNIDKIENYFQDRLRGITVGDFASGRDLKESYQDKKKISKDELFETLKIDKSKISSINLFAVHLFADAAHVGGRFFLFRDYYSQFTETLSQIKKKNDQSVLWIIKPHPSGKYHNETLIVENFVKNLNYSNIVLYPNEINLKSVLLSIDKLVTGRGNIGVEYACLGKKAIIAGVNPYSDLGFVSFPKTKKEYFDLMFSEKYITNLNDEQTQDAKKTLYLMDHKQKEIINRGKIIPEKQASDYKMSTEKYFSKIIQKLNDIDFRKDEYYKGLKKYIINWNNKI